MGYGKQQQLRTDISSSEQVLQTQSKCDHKGQCGALWRGRSVSPSQPSHTVHGDAAARFLSELGVEQLEPVVHDLGGGRSSIIKGPILEREAG